MLLECLGADFIRKLVVYLSSCCLELAEYSRTDCVCKGLVDL